jgi:uncharacterized protein YjbK
VPDLGLDHPAGIMNRLVEIESDLAIRQNNLESSARQWYGAKRDIEKEKAQALLGSDRASVTEKKAEADLAAYDVQGAASEAEYEALKAVVRVLETRATVCQSLLKAHGRT